MLGAPDRPHDAMTGPGLISLFCFLITAAYFLRGGMCVGIVLCMGLAFFSFSRRGWLRRSVTFLLQVSLLFWGAEAWRLARLWMMEGGPFLLWTFIPAAALLLHAAAILWRRRGEKNLPVPELARSRVFSVSVLLLFLLDALVPFRLLMGERILPWQGANGLAILLLAWWGGYCAEGLLNPQTSPRRRQVMWTVFASAFFLQFLLGVTVAPSLLMTGKLHIPVPFMMISGPVYREEGFFMLALFSVSVLMAGSSWCSHLCYFGVWDCLAAASSRRKGHPVPGGKQACDWRWFSLAAAVGIPLLLSVWGVPLGYALAAAFAVALTAPFAWKKSSENGVREYCSKFCPMGLAASLLGRLSPWRMRVRETCTGCMRCASACRDLSISRGGGACCISRRCTLCRDCISRCPHGALSLGMAGPFSSVPSARADMYFVTLVSVMHVVFLATARI
ncbi:4Fe-4S binding protein [Akkermansia muciniphila]|uniref:4Fe-4S binding protein n=1 Tax=Akkermansia muciniphila TaxID=239935 RepID=UPI001F20CD80|nr:hypothetical protein [Akkermansia muciniphila]